MVHRLVDARWSARALSCLFKLKQTNQHLFVLFFYDNEIRHWTFIYFPKLNRWNWLCAVPFLIIVPTAPSRLTTRNKETKENCFFLFFSFDLKFVNWNELNLVQNCCHHLRVKGRFSHLYTYIYWPTVHVHTLIPIGLSFFHSSDPMRLLSKCGKT